MRKKHKEGDNDIKLRVLLGIVFLIACLSGVPAAAQCCHHHGHHCGDCADCDDCDHHCYSASQSSRSNSTSWTSQSDRWVQSTNAAIFHTTEGKIFEVIYLPGGTEDSGMVEIRLQAAGQARLVRLAPSGFLKQSGLLLKEGDTVRIKGYPVDSMEGDLLVATEISKGDKNLPLRDSRGRPAW